VRAYRRNTYQDIVIGQATENGATFVMNFDYNKFKDLFISTPEEKARKRTQKAEKKAKKAAEKSGEQTGEAGIPKSVNNTGTRRAG
jgi:hypothetical protein